MEIVYSILKGINVIVRELNIDNKQQEVLSISDFNDFRIIKLKKIEVMKRKFFENAQAKDLKLLQYQKNKEKGSFK